MGKLIRTLSLVFLYILFQKLKAKLQSKLILFSSHHWELQFNFNNNRASSIIFLFYLSSSFLSSSSCSKGKIITVLCFFVSHYDPWVYSWPNPSVSSMAKVNFSANCSYPC